MPTAEAARRRTVAILAPHGRDAAVARDLLAGAGIEVSVAASVADLARSMRDDLGCALVTEESLQGPGRADLDAAVEGQAIWSDLPFVVLTNGATAARSDAARARIDALGNAVLLARPLHAETLVRAVRSALDARARQYEARARMEELEARGAQLRESEAKFHAIADSVDQMIFSALPDGTHDYFNDRWQDYTGVPAEAMPGVRLDELIHPDEVGGVAEATRHAFATGEAFQMEYRLRHRSGEHRWVLGRAKPQRDVAGRITRWYGTCTDIHDEVTARRATVDQLMRQRDAAWSLSQDLISVSDVTGRIEAANPSWTRILGYAPEEVVGLNGIEIGHPEDAERAGAALADVLATPLDDPVDLRMRHRDGSYRTIAFTASSDGERIVAFGRDVTAERARDAALAASEAALRQSQKLETIGQLTGGVAHDFNNLLMAIRSSLDLLGRRLPPGDARARQFLDNALQATGRGASLIQRMLAFARRQDLHADAVDVAALLSGLRELLQRSIGPRIAIDLEVAGDVPPALVDANQLEMAILNLAVNGRDAMDGAGRLRVALEEARVRDGTADLAAGAYVRIAVADTGAGMDEATLAQAMEPFFTTKGVGKGTGLGLSMVHGLAVQSGGTFRMRSAVGAGTTAELYLPVAQDAIVASLAAEGPAPVPEPPRGGLTILAVDDDVLVLMGTVGLMEDMGHRVHEAHSAKAALAVLEDHPDIDLLVTDQAMPKMTGTELADAVRRQRPDLPIILASGYAEMPEGAGGNIASLLKKPFGPADLAAAIERARAREMGLQPG